VENSTGTFSASLSACPLGFALRLMFYSTHRWQQHASTTSIFCFVVSATEVSGVITCSIYNLIRGNKRPTRCNRLVFYCKIYCPLNMFRALMPIIRSSRVIQMVAACSTWHFGTGSNHLYNS